MKKRIIAKRSLMLPNLPINIEDLADKKLLEPLKQYLNTSPGMTGTTDKLPALEILLKMSSSTLD